MRAGSRDTGFQLDLHAYSRVAANINDPTL
jgi:hypothetical protein